MRATLRGASKRGAELTYDAVETGMLAALCGAFAVWEGAVLGRKPLSFEPEAVVGSRQREATWNAIGLVACLAFVGLTRALWSLALSSGASVSLPFNLSNERFSLWRALGALVFVDVLVYFIHRAMHTFPVLWRTHRWHHMPTRLTWVAGFRASLTQTFLWTAPQYLLFVFFDFSWKELAAATAVGLWFQLWEHTRSRWGHRGLEWVVATPGSHAHHHALVPVGAGNRKSGFGSTGVNFSPVFTLWDRLFGTFQSSREPVLEGENPTDTRVPLGVDGFENPSTSQSVRALVGI